MLIDLPDSFSAATTSAAMCVSTRPGLTWVTLIPSARHSLASATVAAVEFSDWQPVAPASVVDQDVGPAQFRHRSRDHPVDRIGIAEVGDQRTDGALGLWDFPGPRHRNHVGARAGQTGGDGRPDPSRRTGNHGAPAGQIESSIKHRATIALPTMLASAAVQGLQPSLSHRHTNMCSERNHPCAGGDMMPDFTQMTLIDSKPTAEASIGLALCSQQDLIRAAWEIARHGALAHLSARESHLVRALEPARADIGRNAVELTNLIRAGGDPLGEAFTRLRSPDLRRPLGATYTPREIVSSMVAWVAGRASPARVVDPGTGSARFLLAAGRAFPKALLVGVEIDPLAALMARANLTAASLDLRSCVIVDDYRTTDIGDCAGTTAFIGNPPYVRHHQIESAWKEWLARNAAAQGLPASGLAGLHVHFLLATAIRVRPGDIGAFVTSAEWLDVNYGRLPRNLVATRLGGVSIHLVDPRAMPFAEAATTAAVTCFEVGTAESSIRIERVSDTTDLGVLDGGKPFSRRLLRAAPRWSALLNGSRKPPEGYVELGEFCRVHRGAVTGANSIWITDAAERALPADVLFPCVTRAKELFEVHHGALSDASALRVVVGLPADLDLFDTADRQRIDRFLRTAERRGVRAGYIARTRKPWWSVDLRAPAPILATYMARRPPAFVRNLAAARNVNVAHGIYPRESMSDAALDVLAAALRDAAPSAVGRTYAGGLLKFEPSEMARICVPGPAMLEAMAA